MATKFNEEICNELCQYREEGLDMKYCADLAGIHRNTLTNWINKGKKAKKPRLVNIMTSIYDG